MMADPASADRQVVRAWRVANIGHMKSGSVRLTAVRAGGTLKVKVRIGNHPAA
jgi:hypothetical protein